MSEPEELRGTYRASMAIVLRSTAAAYGYTLTIATSVATLIANQGPPTMVELYLFIAGGSLAFAGLELALRLVEPAACEVEHVYPLAPSTSSRWPEPSAPPPPWPTAPTGC